MNTPYLARSRWLAEHILPHEPAMRRWLSRLTLRSQADVDDIVQETYAILAKLESVSSIRDPLNYALQVAKSVFLQEMRRNKVVTIGSIADLAALGEADDSPGAEQHVHGQRELRRVEAAIGDMPTQVRRVFWLRRVGGLTQRETANQLGLAEHTVEKYSAKGMKILLARFGRSGKSSVESSTTQDPTLVEFDSTDARSRKRR